MVNFIYFYFYLFFILDLELRVSIISHITMEER